MLIFEGDRNFNYNSNSWPVLFPYSIKLGFHQSDTGARYSLNRWLLYLSLCLFFSSIIIATRSPKTYFRCITLAYLGYLAFISMMYLASITPDSDPDSNYSQSFNLIYNLSNYRVYLASLCAYFVSTFMFGVIFSSLKINSISIRITISTIIVSLVDVKLFLALAYFGVKDNGMLISIMFWSSVTKLVAQLVLLPPAIFIINTIRDRDECYF